MSTRSATFYWAACDGTGCARETHLENDTVYDSEAKLADQFIDHRYGYERNTLLDQHDWIQVGDKHFCPDHNYFDDDTETRLPLPAGRVDVSGKDAA
jgi:hypothetical protein